MEHILDKLRKIHALSSSDVPGEAAAAQKMMAALCKKYHVDIDDLCEEEKRYVGFRIKDSLHRKLLINVACYACGTARLPYSFSKRVVFIKVSQAQGLYIRHCLDHYEKLWKRIVKDAMVAFIHANGLFPPIDEQEHEDKDPIDQERINRIASMMSGMKVDSYRLQIAE